MIAPRELVIKKQADLYRWPDERIPLHLRDRRARHQRVMREARYVYPFLRETYWFLHANLTYNFRNVTVLASERARRRSAAF